jgi:hypothetical protein
MDHLPPTRSAYEPNPDAENVVNQQLGYDYWLDMVAGNSADYIRVYIMGQYGTVQVGKPVYPEYDDRIHLAESELAPIPGQEIVLGWDFGLTPACAFIQQNPANGQIWCIDEQLVEDHGKMALREFAETVVRPYIESRYPGYEVRGFGDPAGKGPAQTDGQTCYQILDDADLPAEEASTNFITPRLDAVKQALNRRIGEQVPGFILSPRCKRLRRGFNGRYFYERIQVAGDERYKDQPVKNLYSHVHDALQYAMLHFSYSGPLVHGLNIGW